MAPNKPDLQAKLRELDHEFEEGDITRKGYEKRRTVLLSQYMSPEQADQLHRSIQAHHRDSSSSSRPSNSFDSPRTSSNLDPRATSPPGQNYGYGHPYQPPSHVARFQEQQLGAMRHPSTSSSSSLRPPSPEHYDPTRSGTMMSADYRFNPGAQPGYEDDMESSRLSTLVDSHQNYFSDFAGQQMQEGTRDSYGGPNRYSDAFPPGMGPPMMHPMDLSLAGFVECQMPLEHRGLPDQIFDPHNGNTKMSQFDSLGAILRHRGKTNARQTAFWVLDNKGKEVSSITFEKFASRAEKVSQVITAKSNLYRGDRVALVYRDCEMIDFAVALMGCFLAGVVAVPMNGVDNDFAKLKLLLNTTQAHLALTTEENLKKFQRDISTRGLKWPTGVEWWKTNEFGSSHHKKRDDGPKLPAPEIAYIEFSRAPTGDLRGVVLSHRTILHQMACLQAILTSIPNEGKSTGRGALSKSGSEIILSYLDPREGVGLLLGILMGVYGGHTVVSMNSSTVDTPGLYAHLITKYRTTVILADYPGLMKAVYNYQTDPMATRNYKKNTEPNFSTVRICLIDTLTINCEFHEVLSDRWLRPLYNTRARELVAPMLCLPEHGGMIISVRDWLGGEDKMGCPLSQPSPEDEEKPEEPEEPSNGYSSLIGGAKVTKTTKPKSRTELSEVLLDKEAFKLNEVRVLAMGEEAAKRANEPGTLRVGGFGYPIPDATLAVVNPETSLLCAPYSIGEIWVDSPSLSGGFWALPKHTETIFHARPFRFVEGDPNPVLVEPEFLRTGLLGCVIEGKVFILGLYEDRIRQRVEGLDGMMTEDHRYFFVQHLVVSVMKKVLKIYDCSAFDSHINGEYLPIILLESQLASTAPTTAGGPPRQLDIPLLDSLSERVMDVLYAEHGLRVYCVMLTAPNSLPRIIKNGRREIGNMLCRKEFDSGQLACVHVKFGVERAVTNLPIGDDPTGSIWSPLASQRRQQLLSMTEKQYSGVDFREVVIDDKTSTPLNQFTNIHDLLQWRVARQPEDLAYSTIDSRGKEGKGTNWRKFDTKVAAVAMYLKNKIRLLPGDHVLLMYTHSEDFVYAVYACMCLGVVAIPMAPVDQGRLNEDAPALLHIIADFKIKLILVNHDVDSVLKLKTVNQHLKTSAGILRVGIPNVYNTSKPPKQSHGCRELGLTMRPNWVQPGYPVLVWVYWTPDQRRIAVQLGHDTIMALCKVQKETCQMTSSRPVLGCVRSTIGLGFIHTCLMGPYLASPTFLISPVDFAQTPNVFFHTLSRYKIKDTYATSNMLDHAMAHGAGKTGSLVELKNLMISTEARPKSDVYQRVRVHFAQVGLDRTAVNTVYSHVLNPMVTSRSYMCVEPIELWLDMPSLRRGLIVPVHPDSDPTALLVQDSGMVPVSTQICIVNPETNRLCNVGEYGEIWIQSEANVHSFYGSKDALDAHRFNAHTVDADPNVRYVRTGDLGFLHNVSRPIGPGGGVVDMQVLFVLGPIGETFEVNGLCHFPLDIEDHVERCHRNIVPGGCALFQAGGLVVVLIEVDRKHFLASIVPVIVNCVLNHHHFVVDIVAFVCKGDFPRSRLGEKQRGKILASWVTRKMRTIAQFAIGEGASDEDHYGKRRGSVVRQSIGSNTAHSPASGQLHSKQPSAHSQTMSAHLAQQPFPSTTSLPAELQGLSIQDPHFSNTPSHILPQNELHVDLPTAYPETSFLPVSELPAGPHDFGSADQATPTASRRASGTERGTRVHELSADGADPVGYSPIDRNGPFSDLVFTDTPSSMYNPDFGQTTDPSLIQAAQNLPGSLLPPAAIAEMQGQHYQTYGRVDSLDEEIGYVDKPPPLPKYANKPYLSMLTEDSGREGRLPPSLPSSPTAKQRGRQSRESSIPPTSRATEASNKFANLMGTVSSPTELPGSPAAPQLRVANRDSTYVGADDMEWGSEALQYMGIASSSAAIVKRKEMPGGQRPQ